MLETEIKKLTAALEANTAALTGGADASAPQTPAPQPAVVPGPPAIPAIPPTSAQPPAPQVAAPIVPPAPAAIVPGTPPGAPQQGAVVQPMTHQQAQAEIGAVYQALGPDDTRIQSTMLQYGSARLNEIPAENLFSLVQACKALITA